jgi:hypothetical protein
VSGLTDFQERVARAFFALDSAHGFVLSGGAASGFTTDGLAEALGSIARFRDADFPQEALAPAEIRSFAERWRQALLA